MIPHLCLWPCPHYREWPQASWTDQHQESGRYTSLSTENADSNSKTIMSPSNIYLAKRCWLQMPSLAMHPQNSRDTFRHLHQPCAHHTWQNNRVPDSHPRWPVPLLPCWDNHCMLARWYQLCPTCSTPIPWPQKHPNSWRQRHPSR